MENLIYASAGFISALLVSFLIFTQRERSLRQRENQLTERCMSLEKDIHLKESGFLEEKNTIKVSHYSEIKEAREIGYKEGFEIGKIEREKDYQIELLRVDSENKEKIAKECEAAIKAARDICKAEYEQQGKMYSVVIKPYLKIEKDKGIIWDEYKSYTGYQYQLLVNGIPAFQPHVVIEKSEELKEVDEKTKERLHNFAIKAVDSAINTYLPGASASALMRGEIIEHLP
jgi:hypothetical protein